MNELLKNTKEFKIIPNNFKSSASFDVLNITQDKIEAKLNLIDESELSDYAVGSCVEVFGVNNLGLIYFETKILGLKDKVFEIEIPVDYSLIQRREYSRVGLNQGGLVFKDMSSEIVHSVEDISAGGIKLFTIEPLELDKYYDVEIKLSNNMKIECALSPIRIKETTINDKTLYSISGKFVNLENADRIVLVQYAFKTKMEEQNIENE